MLICQYVVPMGAVRSDVLFVLLSAGGDRRHALSVTMELQNWRKGIPEGSDVTGIVFRHCRIKVCKNEKTKENVIVARVV